MVAFGGVDGSGYGSNVMIIGLGMLGELDTVNSPSISGDVLALSL